MTRNEKKTAIENMAERFMSISDLEGKSMAIMVMQSLFSCLFALLLYAGKCTQ